jgi:hypothetical protein
VERVETDRRAAAAVAPCARAGVYQLCWMLLVALMNDGDPAEGAERCRENPAWENPASALAVSL